MVEGDFFINSNIHVDIKISYKIFEDSIDNFRGQYYILVPDDLGIENGWVIHSATIKSYWRRMKENNSFFIGSRFDDEEGKKLRYMVVNESLKKRRTVRYWIDHNFSLNF